MGKIGKGTGSFGKRHNKSHTLCRRCVAPPFPEYRTLDGFSLACGIKSREMGRAPGACALGRRR
jgi:large subunit ribosomal protein L37e